MPTNTWYMYLLWLLVVQNSVYAIPATPQLGSSVSGSLNRRLDPKQFTLNKKEYTAVPLPPPEQGSFSKSYSITGGFQVGDNHVPAILKQVSEKKAEGEDSKTRKEIEYLKRDSVDLYLYHEWSKTTIKNESYDVSIVVRDIGKLDTPFKLFHEWYIEDENMSAVEGLHNARENIRSRLLWYGKEKNLLCVSNPPPVTIRLTNCADVQPLNIFLRKTAMSEWGMKREIDSSVRVMPIDWAPPDGHYAGVVDIAGSANKSEILRKYLTTIHERLERTFNVETLYEELQKRNRELRRGDVTQEEFEGKTYDVIPIKASPQDRTETYKILGGFERRPALMSFVTIDKEIEGEDAIEKIDQMRGFHSQDRLVY